MSRVTVNELYQFLFVPHSCRSTYVHVRVKKMLFPSSDPTTIFRGNTLVSKMMDEGMRLAGLHYLHSTLRPAMEQVFLEKKPCEIDPTRVKDGNTTEMNLTNLKVSQSACNSNSFFSRRGVRS